VGVPCGSILLRSMLLVHGDHYGDVGNARFNGPLVFYTGKFFLKCFLLITGEKRTPGIIFNE
jgi:hypothetical protein